MCWKVDVILGSTVDIVGRTYVTTRPLSTNHFLGLLWGHDLKEIIKCLSPIFVGGPKEFQTYRSTLPRVVFCLLKLGPLAPIPRRLLDCLWSSLSPKKKGSPLIQATWIPSSQSSIATSKGKFPKYGSTHKITSNFVYHAMIQVSTYAQGKPFIIWLRPCQIQGNHLRNFSTKYNISILYIYIMPLTSLPNHIHYFKE